jgi:hypothetical protein
MKNTVFVAGAPASGKSVGKDIFTDLLTRDGYHVIGMTDRLELERVVANEMRGRTPNLDGSVESQNTILLNPEDNPKFWGMQFKTAWALNTAHDEMFATIRDLSREHDPGRIVVAEIAYGEDAAYPGGPLRQSANEFVAAFVKQGILNTMLLLDIQASHQTRREWNKKRTIGRIPPEEFDLYFKDGGGFGKQEIQFLNGRYQSIQNEHISSDMFVQLLRGTYDTFILPGVRGEGHVQRERGW